MFEENCSRTRTLPDDNKCRSDRGVDCTLPACLPHLSSAAFTDPSAVTYLDFTYLPVSEKPRCEKVALDPLRPITPPFDYGYPSSERFSVPEEFSADLASQHTTNLSFKTFTDSLQIMKPKIELYDNELEKKLAKQRKADLRKQRNKEAARRSNYRKKVLRDHLEKKSVELSEQKLQLQHEIETLRNRLDMYREIKSCICHTCHDFYTQPFHDDIQPNQIMQPQTWHNHAYSTFCELEYA